MTATASGSGSSLAGGTYEVAVSAGTTSYASPVVSLPVSAGQNIVVNWTRQTGDTNTRVWLRLPGSNWQEITPGGTGSNTITSYTPGSRSSLIEQGYTAHLDLTSTNKALGALETSELVIQNNLGRATRLLSNSSSGFKAVQLPDSACTLAGLVAIPASAGAAGTPGTFAYDGDYLYVCTASGAWKRTVIGSW